MVLELRGSSKNSQENVEIEARPQRKRRRTSFPRGAMYCCGLHICHCFIYVIFDFKHAKPIAGLNKTATPQSSRGLAALDRSAS